jgi:Phage tail protein (Tail_P2_I)
MTYADYQLALGHTPLQGPVGEAFLSAFGLMKDAIVEGTIGALRCRWLTVCPDDALAAIGAERLLPGHAGESPAAYRARLLSAWDLWEYAGTKTGLLAALAGLGYHARIFENIDWAAPPSPGYAADEEWWRYWIILDRPHAIEAEWFWDDGTTWGQVGKRWGLTMTADDYAALLRTVALWAPAHALLVSIIVVLSGAITEADGPTWGDTATWGGSAAFLTF